MPFREIIGTLKQGSASDHTAKAGSLIIDTITNSIFVHDGVTIGGSIPAARSGKSDASLGATVVLNGGFSGGLSGWTTGTGWAYGTNSAVWTVGPTGAISQQVAVKKGNAYLIQWDQTNSARSNGAIQPSLGTVTGSAVDFLTTTLAGANQQVLTASQTGLVSLAFTATAIGNSTGNITISNISVASITPALASATYQNSDGTIDNRIYPGGSGLSNCFLGLNAGMFRLGTSYQNTAIGNGALASLTGGFGNTAIGTAALNSNTQGKDNTAVGRNSLSTNTVGKENVAVGLNSMINNTTGAENTAIGVSSLQFNRSGWSNTALGNGALAANVTGFENTAVGENTLVASNSDYNTAIGFGAGNIMSSGGSNILFGYYAGGYNLTTGSSNVLIGNGVDVPTGATSNYLSLANIITATGTNAPSTSATTVAGTLAVAGGTIAINGPGYGNASVTLQADQSTGYNVSITLAPRVGFGAGSIQTNNATPLNIGCNSGVGLGISATNQVSVRSVATATKTANYTVLIGDGGTHFDNTGAAGEVDFTLPAYSIGLQFVFVATAAQILKVIAPASNKIAIGGVGNSSAGGNVSSSTAFASISIYASSTTNQWVATSAIGTWIVA